MQLIIDERQLDEKAIAWWKSLDPGTRGVYLEAVWEIEREPEPRPRKRRANGSEQTRS